MFKAYFNILLLITLKKIGINKILLLIWLNLGFMECTGWRESNFMQHRVLSDVCSILHNVCLSVYVCMYV